MPSQITSVPKEVIARALGKTFRDCYGWPEKMNNTSRIYADLHADRLPDDRYVGRAYVLEWMDAAAKELGLSEGILLNTRAPNDYTLAQIIDRFADALQTRKLISN